MNMNRCSIFIALVFACLGSGASALAQSMGFENMVLVPASEFTMKVDYRWREGLTRDSLFVDETGYHYRHTEVINLPAYYVDKTEVTNREFKRFVDATNYMPEFPERFLDHWSKGTYPRGKAEHPVVWVSLEDAQAYAAWAGKRLPTEAEWQKAAQGEDGLTWPWGNHYDPDKANMDSEDTKKVGSYKSGASPYGCVDMAGNVWEWTDSFTSDGYHHFSWLRGGSHFFAKGSLWYMQGGPINNFQRTKFWYMTPALNRSSSIGFRCVKDAS